MTGEEQKQMGKTPWAIADPLRGAMDADDFRDDMLSFLFLRYQFRKEEPRYARRVAMEEIEKNNYNLNISRYISTAVGEAEIDLDATHAELVESEQAISAAKQKHNGFLKELGLNPLP